MNPTIDQSTAPSTNPSATTAPFGPTPARCIHRTPAGRRCSAEAVDPQASFCRRHLFGSTRRYPDPSLASELLGDLTEFDSAAEVNQFLSRLLRLLAEDRVSPRRAAVMAYTCNLLLHTHRAIEIENKIAANAPKGGHLRLGPPQARRLNLCVHPHTAQSHSQHQRARRINCGWA
ncbi:MAG TPA: hypothetical protein VOA78_11705 [Candidatus Dormibacteraeota bacterium]|nr:hypothetical protein [Candidatus Dormibacteraeota bacterium]